MGEFAGQELRGLIVADGGNLAASSLDKCHERSAVDNDVSADSLRRSRVSKVGPRQRGPVRVGRVGGRQSYDCGLCYSEPVDGAGKPELGTAASLDEVSASHPSRIFHRCEYRVEPCESSGKALAEDGVASDDAVPLEELVGLSTCPFLHEWPWWLVQIGYEIPPSARCRRVRRWQSTGSFWAGGSSGGVGSQWRQRVVGDNTCPYEVPERVENIARVAALGRHIEVPEEGRTPGPKMLTQSLVQNTVGGIVGVFGVEEGDLVSGVQRDPAIASAER